MKSFVIAVLAMVVLVIVAINVKEFRIGKGEAATPIERREWPSLLLKELDDPISPDLNPVQGGVTPTLPGPLDITTPYAFINNTSKHPDYLYGSVYYSPGRALPKLLYNGRCATAIPSGDYVFCIDVGGYDLDSGLPSSTTPIKIDTRSGINYGKPSTLNIPTSDWPKLGNALVPANTGNDYIYATTNLNNTLPNYLTGDIVIFRNGVQYATYAGSFLQPTISSDGAQITWVSKMSSNRTVFGNGDLFTFNVEQGDVEKIYNASDIQECAGPSLSGNGVLQAFSLIGSEPNGIRKQYVYVHLSDDNYRADMSHLPMNYNWNSNVKINDAGSGIVWQAKKERVMGTGNRGYNILAAKVNIVYMDIVEAFQIFPYDETKRKRLPDMDNDGFVTFSNWMGKVPTNYEIWGAKIEGLREVPMFPISSLMNPKPTGMNLGATFTTQT